jgi:hypothetical protein
MHDVSTPPTDTVEPTDFVAFRERYPGCQIIHPIEAGETEFPVGTRVMWRPDGVECVLVFSPGRAS